MNTEKTPAPGKRVMLIGGYAMEVIECGGSLAKNAMAGGVSHAALAFVGERMRRDIEKSAAILGVSLEYLDFDSAEISGSAAEKLRLVRAIRAFRPDIIITQDPEHIVADFDPGRRPLMTLIFEAISLAGRDFKLEETAPHGAFSGSAVYYMTPSNPNCLVDILSAWDKKCAAMDALEAQLIFSAGYYERTLTKAELAVLVPGWDALGSDLERGIAAKREIDRATAMFYGACGHSGTLLSEAYRKQELFELDNLIV